MQSCLILIKKQFEARKTITTDNRSFPGALFLPGNIAFSLDASQPPSAATVGLTAGIFKIVLLMMQPKGKNGEDLIQQNVQRSEVWSNLWASEVKDTDRLLQSFLPTIPPTSNPRQLQRIPVRGSKT